MPTRRGSERYPLAWQATLSGMLRQGAEVRRRCGRCNTWELVDLPAKALEMGEDATLWNRTEACDRCGGHCYFTASPDGNTAFWHLKS